MGYLFRDLFFHVFELHCHKFAVKENEIVQAMYELQEGYKPPEEESDTLKKHIDYNKPALRCAYLYKYAGCHAGLVERVVKLVHRRRPWILKEIFFRSDETKICCLGGGPGNDVIGISSVLSVIPQAEATRFKFAIVDKMCAWALTYETVLMAAQSSPGRLGEFLSNRVSSSYHGVDIVLHPMDSMHFISTADIVTMIKFVSAVDNQDIKKMVERVFQWLKPRAVVLFIDNDAGGFYETLSLCASNCKMDNLFGPLRHHEYKDVVFKQQLFGIYSLSKTTVTVQMWMKPDTASNIWLNDELTCEPAQCPYNRCPEDYSRYRSSSLTAKKPRRRKNNQKNRRHLLLANVYQNWEDNMSDTRHPARSNISYDSSNDTYQQRSHLTNRSQYRPPGDYGFFNGLEFPRNTAHTQRYNYSNDEYFTPNVADNSRQNCYDELRLPGNTAHTRRYNYSNDEHFTPNVADNSRQNCYDELRLPGNTAHTRRYNYSSNEHFLQNRAYNSRQNYYDEQS